jgi:RNA polymerase sigma-70 factor (ECF subfamily)
MKYFDDMKYQQISEVTSISVGGLKASYHHAVKKIEKFLGEVKPLTLNNIKEA